MINTRKLRQAFDLLEEVGSEDKGLIMVEFDPIAEKGEPRLVALCIPKLFSEICVRREVEPSVRKITKAARAAHMEVVLGEIAYRTVIDEEEVESYVAHITKEIDKAWEE